MVKYTFNNVGNTFSAKSISNYLKSEQRKIDNETVYSYLEKLQKLIFFIDVHVMIYKGNLF